ncbi:protein neprosin-like [Castanea sativa]|uniref:protein neprosin-like n=1 Tax=Castanea sativa TaxID=21020 RepID=UPI003F64F22A
MVPQVVGWSPPTRPRYKINVDGSVFSTLESVGVGVLIRDSEGQVIAVLSKKINAPLGALEVEARAVEVGLEFARDTGVHDFILEGDSLSYRVSGARILTHEEDSLLEIQLKLINKPPVKSIQTEYGHIVDCIDINKQLAFDHPLLKHHKIQNAVIQMEKKKYYTGVEGSVTVYDPQVKEGQTYAQVYVYNGDDLNYYNLITTGWMVSPDIYHDGSPHFFAVFTDTNYNWWISIEGFVVGYYPKEIVFNLNQPQGLGWGGVAVGNPNGNSAPPMGSGEFSDGSNACEFSNIQYRNQENTTLAPQLPHYKIITDNPKCYDLKYDGYKNPEFGFTFKFGGPGGPCSN